MQNPVAPPDLDLAFENPSGSDEEGESLVEQGSVVQPTPGSATDSRSAGFDNQSAARADTIWSPVRNAFVKKTKINVLEIELVSRIPSHLSPVNASLLITPPHQNRWRHPKSSKSCEKNRSISRTSRQTPFTSSRSGSVGWARSATRARSRRPK